jgi:hypothetical protein
MEWEWKLRGDGWEQLDADAVADADVDVDKRPHASRNSPANIARFRGCIQIDRTM